MIELSPESEALAQAMLLGQKSALSSEWLQAFRTAGMSHILAVSGLHIGILMSLIWMAFRPFEWVVLLVAPTRMRTYYMLGTLKRLLVIGLTGVYVFYIGAPASAVRAFLMLSLCLVGWMLHRPTSSWRCLLLAALVLLAWDPWTLLLPGFQLSFLAVSGILLFQPWLQSSSLPRWIRLVLLSVAAQWLTIPVIAYWFHQLPFLGWLQGLLVVPLLPAFLFLIILSRFLAADPGVSIVIDALTQWMGWVAHATGRLEQLLLGGHLYFYPTWYEAVGAEVLLLCLVLYLLLRHA